MGDLTRYARQQQVKHISRGGQYALAGCRVLVVGAGGLGCQVATQLAGAGVGELIVVEHDTVSLSNLHRQILYRERDIGHSKAKVAGRELRALNSEIKIEAFAERLSPANAARLVEGCNAVVDAADNFATSYVLSDACSKDGVPLVSASVNATYGHLGVFCAAGDPPAPGYRAVFPRLPRQSMNCDTVGVTGPSVGIVASLQAQETLKVLTDGEGQLRGKLLYLDLWNYAQHIMDVSAAPEPGEATIQLLDDTAIRATDFVLDVRDPQEIADLPQPFETHGAIPLPQITDQQDQLPTQGRIVCVCRSGQRGLIAAQLIVDAGFTEVAVVMPSE